MTGQFAVEALDSSAVDRQDVARRCLDQQQPLHLVQPLGVLLGEAVRLRPVGRGVLQLPTGERRHVDARLSAALSVNLG